jgi:hypothetical protein
MSDRITVERVAELEEALRGALEIAEKRGVREAELETEVQRLSNKLAVVNEALRGLIVRGHALYPPKQLKLAIEVELALAWQRLQSPVQSREETNV